MIGGRRVIKALTFIIVCFITSSGQIIKAGQSEEFHDESHSREEFRAGEFIIEHVGDDYSWHILSYGPEDHPRHISIPLPVILYSLERNKLFVFFSGKFHHGHEAYKDFFIAHEAPYKGDIVELNREGEMVRPIDLSISKNVFAIFVSIGFMLWIFLSIARSYKKNPYTAPKGLQSGLEPVILFVRDEIARPSIGQKNYNKFMPFLLTLFFFIWINNLMGLIPIFPGGANVTGNISVTLVLALFTFFMTTFSGNKHYWKDIFNAPGVPWWLKVPIPLMPIIELMGMFTKPFVLMVRLFANITAGHIIVLGFFSLIFIFGQMQATLGYGVSVLSILFTVFMTMLELLVALIQAYVFTLLSAIYFGMATAEHH